MRPKSRAQFGSQQLSSAHVIVSAEKRLQESLPVHSAAYSLHALPRVLIASYPARQRCDRSSLQDDLHAATETIGHALEPRGSAHDIEPASDPAEPHLEQDILGVLGRVESNPNANLRSSQAKAPTDRRVNLGFWEITPMQTWVFLRRSHSNSSIRQLMKIELIRKCRSSNLRLITVEWPLCIKIGDTDRL